VSPGGAVRSGRRWLTLGLLASTVLVASGCGAASTPAPQGGPTPIPRQAGCAAASTAGSLCIVILGDSLGEGVPLAGEERWSARLRRRLEEHFAERTIVVDNWAVSGGRVNVLESAIRDQPDIGTYDLAIVIEGVNDLWDGTVDMWRPRYAAAIEALEAKGVIVILATPPPELQNGVLNTRYDDLAAAIRSMAAGDRPVLDLAARWHADGALAATYYADAIHQNAVGQALMAELATGIVLGALGTR
jgi:lysophospholipase L1-like esterase